MSVHGAKPREIVKKTRTQGERINTATKTMNEQVYIITADGGNIAVCRYYQDARETAQYWRTRKGLRNVKIHMRTIY